MTMVELTASPLRSCCFCCRNWLSSSATFWRCTSANCFMCFSCLSAWVSKNCRSWKRFQNTRYKLNFSEWHMKTEIHCTLNIILSFCCLCTKLYFCIKKKKRNLVCVNQFVIKISRSSLHIQIYVSGLKGLSTKQHIRTDYAILCWKG